jgi:hypothetical protein
MTAEVTATAKNIGGSIAVFIPAEVVRREGIEAGKPVRVTVRAVRPRGEAFGRLRGLVGPYRSRAEGDVWGDW